MLTHKANNVKTIDIIFSQLEKVGYEVNYKVLNSADFGVPQVRKRIFIVGFLKKYFFKPTNFKFPKSEKESVYIKDFLEKQNFTFQLNSPTHKENSLIVHLYTKNINDTQCLTNSCYYSDHFWINAIFTI